MSTKRGRKGFSNPAESQAHVSNGYIHWRALGEGGVFFFRRKTGRKSPNRGGWGSTNPTDLPILPAFPPRVSEKVGMLRCHSIEWKDLESKLLLISINNTPKTSHSCLKLWYTMLSRDHFFPYHVGPIPSESADVPCLGWYNDSLWSMKHVQ